MRTRRSQRQDYGYSRTVSYDSRSHCSVIFQCFGSVWRKVLPYCLFNVTLTAFLLFLLTKGIDCTVSEWSHEFMSVLVSFLVITKFNLTLSVYYEMQKNLMIMGSATRQIVLLACTLTPSSSSSSSSSNGNLNQESWRSQVAYHALLMISTTSTMLTKANDWNAWEAPGMSEDMQNNLHLYMDQNDSVSSRSFMEYQHNNNSRHYEYGHNLASDLNLRVPIRMAHKLQAEIASSSSSAGLDSIQVQQMMDQVGRFLDAFHGIRVYLNIPLPFSMVQMARIFLFLYTFTLPFAILSADLRLGDFQVLLLVFVVTYGFMGIEIVCMDLDDPFGSDATDLPVMEQAREVFEDAYLMIQDIDGFEAACRLRSKMNVRAKHPEAPSEKASLL